jgi:secernin
VSLDALSNHVSLGSDWEIGSKDLESFARTQGWWSREARIDVAAAYRNPQVPGRISEGRLRRSRALLSRSRGQLDVASLQTILRDHLEGGPARLPGSTPEDERFFTLCMHSEPVGTTTASLVAPLPRERSAPWPVWISFGTPCTGIFLPVYLDGVIPAELARGGATLDDASAWWSFKRLQNAAAPDFPRHTPRLRAAWQEFEARVEAERLETEARARAAGDRDEAAAQLSAFMARSWEQAVERARRLTHTLPG